MRIFRFDPEVARPITQFGSGGASIAPIARPEPGFVQLGCMYIVAGGHIERHPASSPQLFLVVAGEGWVSGADGLRVPIRAGEAAFWEPGEAHESGSEQGMTALVLEAEALDPAQFMPEGNPR